MWLISVPLFFYLIFDLIWFSLSFAAGSICFGYIITSIGAKRTVLFLCCPCLICWAFIYFGNSYYHIFIGEFLAENISYIILYDSIFNYQPDWLVVGLALLRIHLLSYTYRKFAMTSQYISTVNSFYNRISTDFFLSLRISHNWEREKTNWRKKIAFI